MFDLHDGRNSSLAFYRNFPLFDLDLGDLDEGQRSHDLSQVMSPGLLYNYTKQSSRYLFICLKYGCKYKIHVFALSDLENALVDPIINRLCLRTIPYYDSMNIHPRSFSGRGKVIVENANHLYFDLDLCDLDLQIYK